MPRDIELNLTLKEVSDEISEQRIKEAVASALGSFFRIYNPNVEGKVDGKDVEFNLDPFYDKWISEAASEYIQTGDDNKLRWMYDAKRFRWNPQDYDGTVRGNNPET